MQLGLPDLRIRRNWRSGHLALGSKAFAVQVCATWKWIGADANPSPERKRGVATPAFAAGPRQPLAYARGSDSRIPYARILSIGLHFGTSSTSKSRTRYFFCSCGPG